MDWTPAVLGGLGGALIVGVTVAALRRVLAMGREREMTLAEQVEEAMTEAIHQLARTLDVEVLEDAPTHRTVIVSGWDKDECSRRSIARYLVGLRACAIDAALRIRADLENTEADRAEILENVKAVVGESNGEPSEEETRRKKDERNPWLAEGIWHLCLVIAAQQTPEIHLPGSIVALNYAHVMAKDHGLDVAAIYNVSSEDLFGLSFIESKASKHDVNGAVGKAVAFFREVNEGKHALRVRQTVQVMRSSLPEGKQAQIPGSFWKRTRAYIPNLHYCSDCTVDWTNPRPSLAALNVSGARIDVIVMPHIIDEYDEFFDRVADEMRAFAGSLR